MGDVDNPNGDAPPPDAGELTDDDVRARRSSRGRPKKKRGRGRPRKVKSDDDGAAADRPSKKKPNIFDGVPAEVLDFAALVPVNITALASVKLLGVRPVYTEDQLALVQKSFRKWFDTLEWDLTPGQELLAAYALVVSMGLAQATPVVEEPKKPAATDTHANGTQPPTQQPPATQPIAPTDTAAPGSHATPVQ